MHPWHDVDLGKISSHLVNAVVEIPRHSKHSYKLDATTGLLKFNAYHTNVVSYPTNYGFFPRTLAADGDALDVFILGDLRMEPLMLAEVLIIGGFTCRSSRKGIEEKIIAIRVDDPEFYGVKSLQDIPKRYQDLLSQFIEAYKVLTGERKKINRFYFQRQALRILKSCAQKYEIKFGSR